MISHAVTSHLISHHLSLPCSQFGLTNPTNLGETLYGLDACAQVDAWHKYGVLETSAAVMAKLTLTNNNLPSILNNKKFVLLGCTSELGPAKSLLLIPGITILGVARGGQKLDQLIDYARYNAPDDTTFLYNPKGADIMSEGPQIAQWVLDETSPKDELVIVPLATLEGEADTRVVVAMDLIIQRIFRQREKSVLAQLLSPATVMVLPPTANSTALKRLEQVRRSMDTSTCYDYGCVIDVEPMVIAEFCLMPVPLPPDRLSTPSSLITRHFIHMYFQNSVQLGKR